MRRGRAGEKKEEWLVVCIEKEEYKNRRIIKNENKTRRECVEGLGKGIKENR